MDNNRDKIIAKVKKCLALAKFGNEHEAAAALRQAQKLMAAHGISDLDIEHADIQEESARAGAAFKPARWECELAVRVARAFDCKLIFRTDLVSGIGRWIFVGATPSGEIARYAFEVLLRQAKKARAHYIKTALKRCTKTRTRRADLFEYIEVFYNRTRRHSSLGYLSPIQFLDQSVRKQPEQIKLAA